MSIGNKSLACILDKENTKDYHQEMRLIKSLIRRGE
jgi:hypothetical protein